MTGRIWLLPLASLLLFAATTAGSAQSVGPDEAIGPKGSTARPLALTAAQKSAIYNVVERQRPHISGITIPLAVGAPVSRADELSELPDPAASIAGQPDAATLKYDMVEGDIVVVDPVSMRVVDIIRGNTRP
jgi:hypothetical protein